MVISIMSTVDGYAIQELNPPELTEKIFDPFFTTKKPGREPGLDCAC